MTAPLVRLARQEDAAAIADAHIRGWRTSYRGLIPDAILDGFSMERRSALWAERIELYVGDHPARIWVVETVAGVQGFAATEPANDEAAPPPPGAGEVVAIYLAPEVRGQGLGRAVFGHAARDLHDRGHDLVVVWVFEANTVARRFYEGAGCVLEGTRHDVDFDGVFVPEVRYFHREDVLHAPVR